MNKKIAALIGVILIGWFSISDAFPPVRPGDEVYTASDCSTLATMGYLCQDTDDGKLYKWDGASVTELAAGASGDVTGVGDCASGACNDGSSDGGTYLRLYDGTSAYESITGGVRTFTFASSTAAAENLVLTLGANDNTVTLSSSTGGNLIISNATADVLTLGVGTAGIDYILKFDGENNDGTIKWLEDEKVFTLNSEGLYIEPVGGDGGISIDAETSSMTIGVGDSKYGTLNLAGDLAGTVGGRIHLFLSGAEDTVIDYYGFNVDAGSLEIGPDTNANAITLTGSNVAFEGTISTGVAGTSVGSVAFKNATSGAITVQPITGALGASTFVLGTTYTDAKWCSYATATGFTCNENAPAGTSQATLHVDDILTAIGIASEAVNLGTFPGGTTISDNTTVKGALGQLETSLETKAPLASPLFTGKIYLGDNANTTMTQGATLNQGANDDEVLAFKSSDVGHPFTADAEADTYAHFLKTSATAGGLSLTAFTDATLDGALSLIGVIGATDPTDAHSAVVVKGRKSGGTDTVAALGNAETVLRVDNHNTALLTMLGNGNTTFAGTLTTPGLVVTKSTGVPGVNLLYEATTTETLGIGWKGPNSRAANDLYLQFPDDDPAVNQFMLFAVPATDLGLETSKATWTTYGQFAALPIATTGTISGGSLTPVVDAAGDFATAFTGANLYGGTFIVDTAGTIALPNATVGMNFTIVLEAAAATVIDPLGTGTADTIVMNGLAAAADENITSSTIGAMCVFQYRAADSWMATCNGFAEATPP